MFAGVRHLAARDERSGEEFPVLALYPTLQAPRAVELGPFTEELAPGTRIAAGAHSLVVISHGTGSWNLLHRRLAARLAQRGYVVALPEHLHNNRSDNRLDGTAENLCNRPRHVSLTIDAALAAADLGSQLRRSVAVIGHSLGAYTALAAAGGTPYFPPRSGERLDVRRDERVAALVLLAPATPWYLTPGSLAAVTAPILMFSGERDQHAPAWHGDVVAGGIPDPSRLTHVRVPNAGHFSFLSPYPPALRRPDLPPATDPEGFDREAFHAGFADRIGEFLDGALPRD